MLTSVNIYVKNLNFQALVSLIMNSEQASTPFEPRLKAKLVAPNSKLNS